MKLSKIVNLLLNNPMNFLSAVLSRVPWIVSDKTYIKLKYKAALGRYPDLNDPQTFTEKIQWLKLYDHNPLYTEIVDKVSAKERVRNIIGGEHIIPTLGVWKNPDEIDFDRLPNQFVLKCNHTGGGSVLICKDKNQFDCAAARKKLKKLLKKNTYLQTREWPYKNIERKVLCEKYLEDEYGELRDYKFYCFNGRPKFLAVTTNRFTTKNFNHFDMDFNPIELTSVAGGNSAAVIQKPLHFDRMKEVVSELCKGFIHVRVDLYYCNNNIYFGELTLYDASGFDDWHSDEWNRRMGGWVTLPERHN